MSESNNAIAVLAAEMEELLRPLLDIARDPEELARYATRMGWFVATPSAIDTTALEAAVDGIDAAVAVVNDDGLDTSSLQSLVTALQAFAALISSLDDLRDLAQDGMEGALTSDNLQTLGEDIVNELLVSYLGRRQPLVLVLMELLSLVEAQEQTAIMAGDVELRSARDVTRLNLASLGPLLSDPAAHLGGIYLPAAGFVDSGAAEDFLWTLFGRLRGLVRELGGDIYIGLEGASESDRNDPANAAYLRTATVRVPLPVPDSIVRTSLGAAFEVLPDGVTGTLGRAGPALEISPYGLATMSVPVGEWTVTLTVEGDAGTLFASESQVITDAGSGVTVELTLAKGSQEDPALRIGADSGSRLEIGRTILTASASLAGDAPDWGLGVAFEASSLVVSPGDGDSFLGSVISNELNVDLDLGIAWSKSGGLELAGSAGLEVEIPLGFVLFNAYEIQSATLRVEVDGDGIELSLGVASALTIGPFAAVVDGLGLSIYGEFAQGNAGNLGPLEASIAFKPPTGVGIAVSIDGVASGGGFLRIDHEQGRYDGILDVDILGIGITVTGLIATQMPDGSDGWSMFMSLSATFTGLQIGFGFTLNGVGGLVGVHRGLDVEALGDGIRTGAMDSILFPDDPIADANRILSDLDTIFPTQQDQYVFGPIAKIGWGTPTLIEADLGIVIQLPDPITFTLLGSLGAELPDKQTALLVLNIDVAGTFDLTAGTLSIDASLRDSRVLDLSISGDMAMRAAFVGAPSFLLSFGGFNPHFAPPANFPDLNRLSVSLETGDIIRIGLWGYFGLTSNTVQFGSGADLWAKAAGLTVEGHFNFDALIQFTPFAFIVDLGFSVDVRAASVDLFGVHLDLMLEGPNPFHVVGSASMKILGIKTSFSVDETIGDRRSEGPQETVNAQALLIEAIEDAAAWRGVPPDPNSQYVTFVDSEEVDEAVLHPAGSLEVVQRVVPLKRTLEKFGSAQLGDLDRFELLGAKIAGVAADSVSDIDDWFAPAQFFAMSDEERLSSPSFEEMPGGIRIGDNDVSAPAAHAFELDYEQIVRDPDLDELERGLTALYTPTVRDLAVAVAQTTLAPAEASPYSIAPTAWAVADASTGIVDDDITPQSGVSWTEARSAIAQSGAAARTLIPLHETSDAA